MSTTELAMTTETPRALGKLEWPRHYKMRMGAAPPDDVITLMKYDAITPASTMFIL